MARGKSLTPQLYRLERANVRAARGGPASYGKRVVRPKVYAKSNGTVEKLLRSILK
jgi:hypothetical protein